MTRRILSLIAPTSGRKSRPTTATSDTATPARPAAVESLERRTLFANPVVVSTFSDNRGDVAIVLSEPLDPATVNETSVTAHTAGADGDVLTADDQRIGTAVTYHARRQTIYVTLRDLTPDVTYRVRLNSKIITSVGGDRLDGEFNGPDAPSGDGVRGGDYNFKSQRDLSRRPVTRFKTNYGDLDVVLFRSNTPITVANFMHYANEGSWDGTFFHRSLPGFVVQGGGFNIDRANNTTDRVHQHAGITNEPVLSNKRGRISMAKLENLPNSATNQWFFNHQDNSENLDNQNGGFTAFGEIANRNGFALLDQIAKLGTRSGVVLPGVSDPTNQATWFDDVPMNNVWRYDADGQQVNPNVHLVMIRRVSIVNNVMVARPPVV